MTIDMASLLEDLMAETAVLEGILAGLGPGGWETPTPAAGWSVRDQVSHLAAVDELAVTAATDPRAFAVEVEKAAVAGARYVDEQVAAHRGRPAEEMLPWLRSARRRMVDVLAGLDPKARVPWFGVSMGAASFATARIMETWAHGQDVADAVGAAWPVTDRVRHVADIGVRAMPNSFRTNRRPVPAVPLRVELDAPGGGVWAWGPEDAADVVRGPARDFCLVVTQRRHPADTALEAVGPAAAEWLSIAQAFAGPPGQGRPRSPAGGGAPPGAQPPGWA